MQYIKVTFPVTDQSERDLMMAALGELGYEGFEETAGELYAYIGEAEFTDDDLKTIPYAENYLTELIPEQNWNEVWESNFQPVVIDDFCTIRAHFHDINVTTPHEIVITPKMSFGTGHHATTSQMMQLMELLDFRDKQVLDFGTGTGVLAILAEKLGAKSVLAIDNDEWPVKNAIENAARNNCSHISVKLASVEDIDAGAPDIILANINRHILLQYMPLLSGILKTGGDLLLSGILLEDEEVMSEATKKAGLIKKEVKAQSGWLAIHFVKP